MFPFQRIKLCENIFSLCLMESSMNQTPQESRIWQDRDGTPRDWLGAYSAKQCLIGVQNQHVTLMLADDCVFMCVLDLGTSSISFLHTLALQVLLDKFLSGSIVFNKVWMLVVICFWSIRCVWMCTDIHILSGITRKQLH